MSGVPLDGALLGVGLHFIYVHVLIAQNVPLRKRLTGEGGGQAENLGWRLPIEPCRDNANIFSLTV